MNPDERPLRIGLALGGGGARGLAHVPVLEVLDELGIRPACIAGTSIGAVMGAIFASGARGAQIRERLQRMLIKEGDSLKEILSRKEALSWFRFLDIDFLGNALLKGDAFVEFLCESIQATTFEDLAIPLKVIATDFWHSRQVVLESGDLLTAIKASMGLPGLFSPVRHEGRILIDGGAVNPLPCDVLEKCHLVIAVNVMGRMVPEENDRCPTAARALLETFNILQRNLIRERIKDRPPGVYVEPDIRNVDLLDFHKAEEIFAQAEPAARRLRDELLALRSEGENTL